MSNQSTWRRVLRLDAALLIVSVLAGVTGAVLASRYLAGRAAATEASLRGRYETRAVVVAATDLPAGAAVDASQLAARNVPSEFLPPDAVPVSRAAQLIGAHTAVAIRRGTPVVPAALRTGSDAVSLSSLLAAGRRAVTIPVDEVNSQSGNLRAGDWVDLLYTRNETGGASLVPLLQHVQLMATGATLPTQDAAAGEERSYGTITLDLTANEATRVLLAQQSGTVSVVLRATGDQTIMAPMRRSSRDLFPGSQHSAVAESRVELLVGGGGGLVPERSWLPVGRAPAMPGESS